MKLRLLLLNLILFACSFANAQLYTFRNYNHRHGLNMGSINCLAQSNDGYVWLGTDGADLVRFDGSNFSEMREENGDNNHHYENIFFHENNILFASRYKGFFSFDRTNKKFKRFDTKGLKFGEALACLAIDSTFYFIGTSGVLSQQKGKTKTLQKLSSPGIEIHQIVQAEDALFLFTSEGSFRIYKNKVLSLDKWLNVEVNHPEQFQFGFYENNKLTLLNEKGDRWLEIILNKRGGFFSIKETENTFSLSENEKIISFSFNKQSKSGVVLTNQGTLFKVLNQELNSIAHNYNQPLIGATSILTDYNGDFWITSMYKGIYKVSEEAFTKLQIRPIYENPDIKFPFRTIYGDIIISLMSGETHVRSSANAEINKTFDFVVQAMAEVEGDYYAATSRGLKLFDSEKNAFSDIEFTNQNVTFLMKDQEYLWVGVAAKGLYRMNVGDNQPEKIESNDSQIPNYFYTGQVTNDQKQIYFGTNNGIFVYTKNTKSIKRLPTGNLGSYSGVSTTDVYGNLWFTMEKGLVGINSKGKLKVIDGNKYMRTNLFYTLSSDNNGNLVVGTNKGITLIKIDKNGDVREHRQYDANSGFEGYETHMRSQFKNDEGIYFGTVEGLFLVNTSLIENLKSPLSPVVTDIDEQIEGEEGRNNFTFKFHVNNAKAGKIKYSYRIKGLSDEWTILEDDNEVRIYDLSNGLYTLEARSSFDGFNYSPPTFHEFRVNLPIWRTNWFILIIVAIIVGINVSLIWYNKSFDTSSLLDTKDTRVHLRMTPALLLFGTIAVSGAHLIAPMLNPELELHLELALIVGFALLTLFFLSLSAKKSGTEHMFSKYLMIAMLIITLHFYYELFVTRLHPFHLVGVILISTIIPYIFSKIKSTIIFSIVSLAIAVVCTILVQDPVYPKAYFLIAIFVMVSLLIFISFLRFDSIEKLMFISGIINKGNIPAVAFDRHGNIEYVSENISNYIDASHDEILNKNISILNNYVPFEGRFQEVDVLKEFKDGEKYLVPMASKGSDIKWIEWSYKDFSKNVKVMLGQDVTEKLELENTYELLVQNAEDFIYRCDVHGNFIFLNDICFSKMGHSKEDLIGQPATSIIAEEYQEELSSYYENHFRSKKISSYKEFPIKKKDGSTVWIGQFVTTLFAAGSDSYINGFIALARDITEDRKKQQLIKEQRDDITASINYAQRIQLNLLPHKRLFNSYFKDHFITFKPKDIVSGDFYWMEKIHDKVILVLADCTGHGVPGSFMTLLGINLLNTIVHEEQTKDPGSILNELDKRLIEILPRGKGANRMNDGMEITVCVIDDHTNEFAYACAGSRFLIHGNDEFTMFKGDNKHIGDERHDGFTSYQTNYAELSSTDQLYLFTDGFQDQFGGPNDKKYSFRRMLELFEDNLEKPLNEQQEDIEKAFDEWIGHGEQTDDLSVISIIRNIV